MRSLAPFHAQLSCRDPYYPGATGAKRHPDEHDEPADSGSDGGYSDNEGGDWPHSPSEARPRRTRTLMTPQQLTTLHARANNVRGSVAEQINRISHGLYTNGHRHETQSTTPPFHASPHPLK